MKNRIIIILAVLLLIIIIGFMVKDFFIDSEPPQYNPYEYDICEFAKADSSLLCYDETKTISVDMTDLQGIATDFKRRIYIAGDSEIQIFDKEGEKVSSFPVPGKARCVFVDGEGYIYAGMKNTIGIFDFAGNSVGTITCNDTNTYISSVAAVDSSVFIADAGNKIVYRYNISGKLLNIIGAKDSVNGIRGFVIPSPCFDLLIGRNDELWVVNPGHHALESYDRFGNLKYSWEKTSMQIDGFSGCCNPTHIAMLSDGSFVTSEKGLVRIKVHMPNGDLKCVVAFPGSFEENTKGLDLAVDADDRILALDPARKQIRIFESL